MPPHLSHLHLQMPFVPDNAKRGQLAMILIQNSQGHFLLGRKKIYPPDISRLIGGGVEPGEEPLIAAQRELAEETGISAPLTDLTHLATITSTILETATNTTYTLTNFVFHYQLPAATDTTPPPRATDDLDGITELTEAEYRQLIAHYAQLSPQHDPRVNFAWSDYGQLYGQIHQIALDALHHVQSASAAP